MKGYKLTKNLKCETLTYEVGREYKIDSMEMCSHGFHFCKDVKDTLHYYELKKDSVLIEVEALGEVKTERNKSVTDHIKVLRVLPLEDHFDVKYDDNGNQIYFKDSNGFEAHNKYDDNGKLIHYKISDGYERTYKYDDTGNLIHYKNSSGFEQNWKYDDNGNQIHYKSSNGFEQHYKYDDNGNLTHYKDSNIEWNLEII